MIEYLDEIMDSSLFKGLTIEEVGKFLIKSDYSIEKYNVMDEVKPKDNNIMFLVNGVVGRYYIDVDGNSTITNLYFNITENIINIDMTDDFYCLNYKALTPVLVLFVNRNSLKNVTPEIAVIKDKIFGNIFDTLTFITKKNEAINVMLCQKGVRNKVLKFIEYQKNPPNNLGRFILTKSQLANMLKVDYTSLCREVKKLSEEIPDIDDYITG